MHAIKGFSGSATYQNPTLELLKKELAKGNVPFPQKFTDRSFLENSQTSTTKPKKKLNLFKKLALGAAAALTLKFIFGQVKSLSASSLADAVSSPDTEASDKHLEKDKAEGLLDLTA